MQPQVHETEDRHTLTLDCRPEWTRVSLGRDFNITVCTVSRAILTTRTSGFPTLPDIDRYCDFIQGVISEGLNLEHPYIHVMELSGLTGGTLDARNRLMRFLQGQSQLKGIVVCNASAFMRMNIKLALQRFPLAVPIRFCQDLDRGIHLAGRLLELDFPEYLEWLSTFFVSWDKTAGRQTHIALAHQNAGEDAGTSFRIALSEQHSLDFLKIAGRILLCRIKGSAPLATLDPLLVLNARQQAVRHCLADRSPHVEIWDGTNLEALLGRMAVIRLFRAIFKDGLSLAGCFILDTGCRIRALVRWCRWRQRPRYPVQCQASLTMTILQARERLQTSGCEAADVLPTITAKSEWHYEDREYYAENEIIDQDIVHSVGTGFLQVRHIEPLLEIQRRLAMQIYISAGSYYLLSGVEMLRGASYKARQNYFQAVGRLYRDYPFRMQVFYGARGRTLAGINLGKYQAPFRVMLAGNLNSALAMIRADKLRRSALNNEHTAVDEADRPAEAAAAYKRYLDDILQYLAAINWEPHSDDELPPAIDPRHPFRQVFDALELIRDDIRILYLEQQRADREQRELEKKLERSQKMAALGLLAGGVAHDLNNILSGLLTYPEVLMMDVPESSPLYNPLNIIRKSGEQAAAIVQDLLIMARRGVANTSRLNLNAMLDEYLKSPEHQSFLVRYPMVRLETELSPDVMEITGSPVHLKKAVMNLVANAFEAGQTQGSIKIRTEKRSLDRPLNGYDTVAAGEYAVFQISDRGNGISEQDLPHIFEPFYTRKVMGRSGTGLGMAVVWGTVKDHNGYIDIQTQIGKGTTITLYLPVCLEAHTGQSAESQEDRLMGHGELILVVDDMGQQRRIARAVLEHLGYQVETVSSGEAALEYLERRQADLIVLDMVMGAGMDGLETARRIRRDYKHMKILIVSGYAENGRVREALSLGAGPFIKKPYTIQAIGRAVRQALDEST